MADTQHEKYPDGVPKYTYDKNEFMVNHNPKPTVVRVRDDKNHEKFVDWDIARDDVGILKSYDGFELIFPTPIAFACSTQLMGMFDPVIRNMTKKVGDNIMFVQDFSKKEDDSPMNMINTGYLLERVASSFFYNVKYDECPETYEEPVAEEDAESLILVAEYFDC